MNYAFISCARVNFRSLSLYLCSPDAGLNFSSFSYVCLQTQISYLPELWLDTGMWLADCLGRQIVARLASLASDSVGEKVGRVRVRVCKYLSEKLLTKQFHLTRNIRQEMKKMATRGCCSGNLERCSAGIKTTERILLDKLARSSFYLQSMMRVKINEWIIKNKWKNK